MFPKEYINKYLIKHYNTKFAINYPLLKTNIIYNNVINESAELII